MSSTLLNGFRNNVDRRFGSNGLSFFDRAYLVDWFVVQYTILTTVSSHR